MNSVGAATFRHGVHPDEHKDTGHLPVTRMPFVARYVLLLSQHAGKPSKPLVRVGQRVQRGEMIAEAVGLISTCLHAPVTGKVTSLGSFRAPNGKLTPGIEIEADPFATQRFVPRPPLDWRSMSKEEFVAQVQRAGLVGLGGAAFPSHVKYAVPKGKHVDRLLVNGCECEPFLTCDHRLMVEYPEAVVRGIEITSHFLETEQTTIGVELNKPDAVKALKDASGSDGTIDVVALKTKYPQGAEKMLIKSLFGIEVPAGKLPLDVGMVVNNVGTMAGIADYFDRGQPLIERIVTVAGNGIARPANLLVPIGTPVREVIDHCGGLLPRTREVLMGGPMMGTPLASLDVPILKGTSGILAFTEDDVEHPTEYTCVRCGRCLEACPNFLNPSRLARLARAERFDEMEGYFATDCMECGSCSYVCPSNIPIVHLIRVSKNVIREREAERRAETQRKVEESKDAPADASASDPKSGKEEAK